MRRNDRERDMDFALGVIDKCEYGVMAMNTSDGEPYCVPLSVVRDGDKIYFHAAREGKKTECLKDDSRVWLTCIGDVEAATDKFTTGYESAMVRGHAEEVTDDAEKINALRVICEKYTPSNMPRFDAAINKSLEITAVYKINIDEVTGKCKKLK